MDEHTEADKHASDATAKTSAVDSAIAGQGEYLPFPSAADLNGRFRRLITLCQRSSKISYIKEEQKAKVSFIVFLLLEH